MEKNRYGFERMHKPSFPPDDKMGFVTPAAPGHSMYLLKNYMRSNLLRTLHGEIEDRLEAKTGQSPLNMLIDSLAVVIEQCQANLFEIVDRNPYHRDPGYQFDQESDFNHDVTLMKFHYAAHSKTLREIQSEDDDG